MYVCDRCFDDNCKNCSFGNPCLGCSDYDREKDICTSDGGCGDKKEDK